MALPTEESAAQFTNIVANVPLNCDFPLYVEEEIELIYGSQALRALYSTDYTVELNPLSEWVDFTVTPKAALLTKINALIATPPTDEPETNFVVVRRKLDYTTDSTPQVVRDTTFLSREIDRIHMKLIQLAERAARSVSLPATIIGDLLVEYIIGEPSEGKAPVWRGNKLVAEVDAADISNAQGYAEDAASALVQAQAARDEAIAAKLAAEAAAAGQKWRPQVKAASTGNVNIASAPANLDTIALVNGDRVLLKDQAAPAQNGVYIFNGAGAALTRATDADTWNELVSQVVAVEQGATHDNDIFICTINAGGTLGVTAISWYDITFVLVLASQAEAEAGTENTKVMTALRVRQAQGIIPRVVKTASYATVLGDNGTLFVMNVAGANNFTVDQNTIPTNGVLIVEQKGTGQTTIVAGAGVTINQHSWYSKKIRGQYAQVFLTHEGGNVFTLSGALELA